MVAGHGGAAERHLGVGAAGWVERAGGEVAQVDDEVGRGRAQVGDHGQEGEKVAVSVGKDGDAHGEKLAQEPARRYEANRLLLKQDQKGQPQ